MMMMMVVVVVMMMMMTMAMKGGMEAAVVEERVAKKWCWLLEIIHETNDNSNNYNSSTHSCNNCALQLLARTHAHAKVRISMKSWKTEVGSTTALTRTTMTAGN